MSDRWFAPSRRCCIVHLRGAPDFRRTEDGLIHANVTLAASAAKAAVEAGVRRFVLASSIAVHGKESDEPIEPSSPFRPADAYGRSKRSAEAAVREIAEASRMELAILRPPMIYGPGGRGSFAQLVRLVRSGLPLPLGLADRPRSFCSLANATSALEHLIESNRVVDILLPADPEDFTSRDLVQAIAREMGRRARIWPVPKPVIAAPLALIGRSTLVTSLFDRLCIDRGHWEGVRWRPVQTAAQGIREALSPSS